MTKFFSEFQDNGGYVDENKRLDETIHGIERL
jgi:hypothetical protein